MDYDDDKVGIDQKVHQLILKAIKAKKKFELN